MPRLGKRKLREAKKYMNCTVDELRLLARRGVLSYFVRAELLHRRMLHMVPSDYIHPIHPGRSHDYDIMLTDEEMRQPCSTS